jgi:hypothetical protein
MNPFALLRPMHAVLAATLVLCSLPIAAQETAPAPAASTVRYNAKETISIDFPGGPLSKLSAALNQMGEAKLSIVQSAGLDPVLPAFAVRDVRVDAVIAALGQILEPQGYALRPTGINLAVLSRFDTRPAAFASLQLERKLMPASAGGGWTAEDIIAAIQTGTEFANPEGKSSTLRFKYHPSTKLLFVAGSPQEVDVAQRVFGSLPDRAPPKAGDSSPDKK